MMIRRIGPVLLLALLWTGCDTDTRQTAAPPEQTKAQAQATGRAQPQLPTIRLYLGPHELAAEMALTNDERRTGMMFRDSLEENAGMLFVFPVPHRTGFWMKNTRVPLSAAYIGLDGVILEIHDLEPHDETTVDSASDNVLFVLEVNQNWVQRHNVGVGTLITTERGGLVETFFHDPQLRRRIHQ